MFLRRFVKTSSPLRYARNDDPIDFIYSYVVKSLFKEQPRFDVIIVTRFSRLVNPCLQRYERLDSILRYLSRVYTEGAEDRNGALGPRKPARIPPPRFIRGNEPLEEIGFPIKLYLDPNIHGCRRCRGGKISRIGRGRGEDTFVAWNQREERFSNNFEEAGKAWK